MAYDPKLAERVRSTVRGRRGITEQPMFGGLAFLKDGKMFCGVLGDELLARVGPEAHEAAMARPHVRIMDFTGRPMRGYVFVGAAALTAPRSLEGWVDQCEAHVATLPGKRARPRPRRARAAPAQAPRGRGATPAHRTR